MVYEVPLPNSVGACHREIYRLLEDRGELEQRLTRNADNWRVRAGKHEAAEVVQRHRAEKAEEDFARLKAAIKDLLNGEY